MIFDQEEIAAIEHIARHRRRLLADETLVHEGSRPGCVCLLLKGFAFRYKFLPDGKRQIMGYLIPGDMCDVHFIIFNQSDHSVGLLSDSQVAMVPAAEMMELIVRYPKI